MFAMRCINTKIGVIMMKAGQTVLGFHLNNMWVIASVTVWNQHVTQSYFKIQERQLLFSHKSAEIQDEAAEYCISEVDASSLYLPQTSVN